MKKKAVKGVAPAKRVVKKATRPKVVFVEFDADNLIEMAVRVLAEEGKLSTSLIQKRLKIGYSRAAQLLDLIEELNILAPADGGKPRVQAGKAPIEIKRKKEAAPAAASAPKPGRGRPSTYSDALVTKICTRIAHGQSLRQICRDDDMPAMSTFFDWMLDKDKTFLHGLYERARELQAEVLFDETLEIADDGTNDWYDLELDNGHIIRRFDHEHAQRSKLRVDTRKWYISKVLPKKYGEKLDITSKGKRIKDPKPVAITYVVPEAPVEKV